LPLSLLLPLLLLLLPLLLPLLLLPSLLHPLPLPAAGVPRIPPSVHPFMPAPLRQNLMLPF